LRDHSVGSVSDESVVNSYSEKAVKRGVTWDILLAKSRP